jgi:tetratricopeptide (TPR) repeat protein
MNPVRQLLLIIALVIAHSGYTQKYDDPDQHDDVDSLKTALTHAKSDSLKLQILIHIGQRYRNLANLDSSIYYYQKVLELVKIADFPEIYQLWYLTTLQHLTVITGNYSMAMYYATQSLELSARFKDNMAAAFALSSIAASESGLGNQRKALDYYFKALEKFKISESGLWAIQNIAETYLKMHMLDSALYYNDRAYYIADTGHNQQYMIDFAVRVYAAIYAEKGLDEQALKYYQQFVSDFYKYHLNNREIDRAYLGMALLYQKKNKTDSFVYYAKKALAAAQIYNDQEHVLLAANLLYKLYDNLEDEKEAFRYFKLASVAKDSLTNIDKVRNIQNLSFQEQIREKIKMEEDARRKTRNGIILTCAAIIAAIISFLIWNRIRQLRLKHKMVLEQKEGEKLKTKYEKELLELEAKALRAQMNPHFVFNSLNSIKSLINKNENGHAAEYLTTFSKLIRTLFQNSDKREISLHEELETCRLYTQIEKMRFGDKVDFNFDIDPKIDLKDVKVPALILQPFIENAIWHGLVPKEDGGKLLVSVAAKNGSIECVIDDNGIGRALSKQSKAQYETAHESKGIGLTRSRLELDKLLNNREDALHIIDKTDALNGTAGTRVILTFEREKTS